jgi:acyl-coenzyme A thioesterase PaaI-like protein
MSKKRIEFSVAPFWKFAMDSLSFDQAFEFFTPFTGACIKPHQVDQHTIEVKMQQTLANTGYMGVHFGGSLYAMCDPFYMFILIQNLGESYIVWDKSAHIDFIKGGKGTLTAVFHIPEDEINEIREYLKQKKKCSRFYTAEVKDEDGAVVAKVKKELYVRIAPGL